MKKTLFWFILGIIFPTILSAQQGNQQGGGNVVNLGEIKLNIRAELPNVQIVDKRVSPDFENVKAEKQFDSEINGKNEYLKFEPLTSMKVRPIKNVQALLNKKRF